MKLVIISASTNDPSNSEFLAKEFVKGAGCESEVIRLTDVPLPQFTVSCYAESCPMPKGFPELAKAIQEADGVVIASPVWNFGVPAHLKNTLDWMGIFALNDTKTRGTLNKKPFYFIFTGGAPAPAWKGLMRFTTMFVREAVRYFDGTIAGTFFEGKCTLGKGQFGLVVDKRTERLELIRNKGAWFARFINQFHKTGKLPLLKRLFDRAYKIGQRVMAKL